MSAPGDMWDGYGFADVVVSDWQGRAFSGYELELVMHMSFSSI